MRDRGGAEGSGKPRFRETGRLWVRAGSVELDGGELSEVSDKKHVLTTSTYTFSSLLDGIFGLLIAGVRRAPIANRSLFKRNFFEQELTELANDAHLFSKFLETTELIRKSFFQSPIDH